MMGNVRNTLTLGLLIITFTAMAQIHPNRTARKIPFKPYSQDRKIQMCLTNDFEFPSLPNAIVLQGNTAWPTGATLRVSFLDRPEQWILGKVIKYAEEWEKHANIKFNWIAGKDGDIRIAFKEGGSWSKVGTIAQTIDISKPTMNFGWFNKNTSEENFRRTVLHEFGHALGLKHEHQSPANDICWDWDKALEVYGEANDWKPQKVRDNLKKLSDDDVGNYTRFDPNSIMIYSIPEEVTTCGFSTEWNTVLSYYDKQGIANLYPNSGARDPIGKELHSYKWSSGRDNNLIFHHRNKPFLFMLKSKSGDVVVHQIRTNGAIGPRIFNKKWSAGWTSSASYSHLTNSYLFLLKKATGDVHIHKINDNGSIGPKLHDYKWSSGWDHVQVIGRKFLMLYKSTTGDVHIHNINSNGSIGTKTYDGKWGSNWDQVRAFQTNYVSYVLLANNASGNVRIKEIDKNGKYIREKHKDQVRKNLSAASILAANNQIYLLNYYKNGYAHQNFITAGGTLGEEVGMKQLKPGWTTVHFFHGDSASKYQKFLLLANKTNGEISIRKINKG